MTSQIRILVDSLADHGLTNAQMGNAREIIRRLDPERFHVSVFCSSEPDPLIVQRPNTRLIQLPKSRKTVKILKKFLFGDHEILFYMKSSPASAYYQWLRVRHRDHRITVGTVESQSDLHNEPTITPNAIKLWEKTVLRCDYLYSNSQAVERSLEREYGLRSGVVPTGVDTNFFKPASQLNSNSRLKVLFVGSLRPFKQPQLVLDAAARFPFADFALAGGGIMESELKRRMRREQLSNVEFLGLLSAEQLREEYQRANVFLFPSMWEGSPKVILEAAACGLPVIARGDYGPETVIDGQTGFLTNSNDEIMVRLEQLLTNADLRRNMGAAGRKHSERFDWDGITKQWEDIFYNLARPQKAASHAA